MMGNQLEMSSRWNSVARENVGERSEERKKKSERERERGRERAREKRGEDEKEEEGARIFDHQIMRLAISC